MMHPDTELRRTHNGTGHGVFATAPIPRGTIVYVKDSLDIDVTPAAYRRLGPIYRAKVDKYAYLEATGSRVLSWDLAKYVNHSCTANSMTCGWGFEIAVDDIPQDAEITDEYGLLNLMEPMRCGCGASECRGVVSSRDIEVLHESWDDTVRTALDEYQNNSQALAELLPRDLRRELEFFLEGKGPYRSVLDACPPYVQRLAGG